MDMRFVNWNVRSLYRAGSLRAVAEEILKFKLDLAGVQEVRWDGGVIAPAGDYTFFYGQGNENHELGTGFSYIRESYQQLKGRVDHILIDRRPHSSILDVRSFRAADCDSDHYLVVAKDRERLAVSKKQHTVHMERSNLKKLNEVEGKEQYCVEISNTFSALENLETEVDVNKAWETIRENIKSAKESLG
ncbi:hypothetical protein B7P43_G12922 [Cryptotermes secundus]|uniref:Endonuclease/exonuclease/phosphatase domain-containing protein n=1 Tax=Cryptotermes secundus TaxID=105785 RepID=A0A2J7Q8E9_9NEOP|nr:hypothetical protein B7P43_G12922 [Cryptotermes secundus]